MISELVEGNNCNSVIFICVEKLKCKVTGIVNCVKKLIVAVHGVRVVKNNNNVNRLSNRNTRYTKFNLGNACVLEV